MKNGVTELPKALDHMTDFEGMQKKVYAHQRTDIPTSLPGLLQTNNDYERLL
jgi:hypothetical protein